MRHRGLNMDQSAKYSRPLVIIGERRTNYTPTEDDKLKGITGGYFCGRCKREVVLSASSQAKIASQPDGTLLCVPCVPPALAFRVWKDILG